MTTSAKKGSGKGPATRAVERKAAATSTSTPRHGKAPRQTGPARSSGYGYNATKRPAAQDASAERPSTGTAARANPKRAAAAPKAAPPSVKTAARYS